MRRKVTTLAAIGCISLGAAFSYRLTVDHPDFETTGSLGSPSLRADASTRELPLSDEQREQVYRGVLAFPDASRLHEPAPELADNLPGTVPLQDLPANVTRAVPLLQGYKFVKLDDRILLIDPASRVVVAMIGRYKLLP
jgi:Protein of unknown function (DUF1236)